MPSPDDAAICPVSGQIGAKQPVICPDTTSHTQQASLSAERAGQKKGKRKATTTEWEGKETLKQLAMSSLIALYPAGYRTTLLEKAVETSLLRWEANTQRDMVTAYHSFNQYSKLASTREGLRWGTAHPGDLMEYLEWWSKEHSPNQDENKGRVGVSPSYVQSHLAHLKNLFELQMKTGPWKPDGSGNPADCPLVGSIVSGYGKRAAKEGYVSKAAVPWGYEKLGALLVALDNDMPTSNSSSKVKVLRDQAMLCFSALLGSRGWDVGRLRAMDITDNLRQTLNPKDFQPEEG